MKNTKKKKKSFTKLSKISALVGCILLVTIYAALPCFAVGGSIASNPNSRPYANISNDWQLAVKGNQGNLQNMQKWAFAVTKEQAVEQNLVVMVDELHPASYWGINALIDNGGVDAYQVFNVAGTAYYTGNIGTRGFNYIVVAYEWTTAGMTPVWVSINNQNRTVVDILINTPDPANNVWSKNLVYLNFGNSTPVYSEPNNREAIKCFLQIFGTNYVTTGSSGGMFVTYGSQENATPSVALSAFVDYIFSVLGKILSIQFFGWYTIGALIGVFMSISIVLVFLKYFAGG